jgi:hypothetical protein
MKSEEISKMPVQAPEPGIIGLPNPVARSRDKIVESIGENIVKRAIKKTHSMVRSK